MTAPKTDLRIVQYPLSRVEKGGILVRVTCCTICGSDVHSWSGRRKAPLPIVLGHEIVGEIAELGEGRTHDSADRPLRIGDRVTWTIMESCGRCFFCRQEGLPMKCRHLRKYGHDSCEKPPHFKGGFAEYCYIGPGACVLKIPERVTDEMAAPANCALATVVAGWEAGHLKPLENVLILGAGALGFYAAAFARHAGCKRVLVADVNDLRLSLVPKFGATDVLNIKGTAEEEVVDGVRDLTDGRGVDIVLEVAGAPELIPVGLKCLRTGGRLVEIGNSFPNALFTYDACDIVWRRLSLIGVHNYDTRHLQGGLDLLEQTRERFPYHEIVTHRVSLDEINEGLRTAQSGAAIRVAVRNV